MPLTCAPSDRDQRRDEVIFARTRDPQIQLRLGQADRLLRRLGYDPEIQGSLPLSLVLRSSFSVLGLVLALSIGHQLVHIARQDVSGV